MEEQKSLEPTRGLKLLFARAEELARGFGAGYVGTGHLLLAMSFGGTGVGSCVLDSLGVTHEIVWREVDRIQGGGDSA